jgi:uncharacterized protein (DUF736 family)
MTRFADAARSRIRRKRDRIGRSSHTKGDNTMAIIGTFKREKDGFTGIIRTLTFTASVSIEPAASKRGEKSPDYRVFCQSSGPSEIGEAWKREINGNEQISVRIDDPAFPALLDCRLIKTGAEHGYSLIWERKR